MVDFDNISLFCREHIYNILILFLELFRKICSPGMTGTWLQHPTQPHPQPLLHHKPHIMYQQSNKILLTYMQNPTMRHHIMRHPTMRHPKMTHPKMRYTLVEHLSPRVGHIVQIYRSSFLLMSVTRCIRTPSLNILTTQVVSIHFDIVIHSLILIKVVCIF